MENEKPVGAEQWMWLLKKQPQVAGQLQEGTRKAMMNALANYAKVPSAQQVVIDKALQRLLMSKDWEPGYAETQGYDAFNAPDLMKLGYSPEHGFDANSGMPPDVARYFATVPKEP